MIWYNSIVYDTLSGGNCCMYRMIQWIFFDIGSTLVDETTAYRHRVADMMDETGLPYDEVYHTMLRYYRLGQKGDKATAERYGLTLTPWHSEDEVPYPDAVDCLRRLHRIFHIGVIANQAPGTEERLRRFGLLPFIDLIVASAEEGVAKPDPMIFQIALERAHCEPEHAVMIGDRLDNDIAPANAIGMMTVRIKQGFSRYAEPQHEGEKPHITVCSLLEIAEVFGQ